MFTPEEGRKYHTWKTALLPMMTAAAGKDALSFVTQVQVAEQLLPGALGFSMKWQQLEKDDSRTKAIMVPEKTVGLIRLSWEPKKPNTERLSAEIWCQAMGSKPSPPAFPRLEVQITVVPPLLASPGEQDAGELYPGGTVQAEFLCFSPTRAELPVTATVLNRFDKPDPCFTCTLTPLTEADKLNISREMLSRVLCGYRVHVQIRERLSDAEQMDLGPFRRTLVLESNGVKELASPTLTGVVRGDVTVGSEDDKDRIRLASFPAALGKSRTVILTADRPAVRLSPEDIEVEPEFLKAELKSLAPLEGRSRWELKVTVPAGRASGILPQHSAVYLKVQDNPPRRIRIPVTGNAYQ